MELREMIEIVVKALPKVRPAPMGATLLLLAGLPGTGKSLLARLIAERVPAVIVESDFIRKTLFHPPTYTGAESVSVHRVAHAIIDRQLKEGRLVIYDATNLTEWHREKAYRLAERARARLVAVLTVAPEAVIQQRLADRAFKRNPEDRSDADWQIYQRLKGELEPVARPHLVVDTSEDVVRAVDRILLALL